MTTHLKSSYKDFFNFLVDYIKITKECLNSIELEYLLTKVRSNLERLIFENYNTIDSKEKLFEDLIDKWKNVSLESLDYIFSRELPDTVILLMQKSLSDKYSYCYLEKYRQNSDTVVLTRNIIQNKVNLINNDTIEFKNYERSRLSFKITRDGYLYSSSSILEVVRERWRLPETLLSASYQCLDSKNFNGSKILNIYFGYNSFDPLQDLILDNINCCQFEEYISYGCNSLISPKANILLINKKNSNYIEFKELLEYCVLSTIPNTSKKCTLCLATDNVALLNHNSSTLKTKYAKTICNFAKYLIEVYGWFEAWKSYKLNLEILLDDNVISILDRAKLLAIYSEKYGRIEELYEIAGIN